MSMKISRDYSQYKANNAEQIKSEQRQIMEAQKHKESLSKKHIAQDEYVSRERSATESIGLYRMGEDENGNPRVFFDAPEKFSGTGGKGEPKTGSDLPEKSAKTCTTNTDKVDREIEKLKEKKQQLEQQIRLALGNEEKVRELEKKLVQIEGELSQKDNDTYRRQNAEIS